MDNLQKISLVPVPQNLSPDMVSFAKSFVKMRLIDGLSISDICRDLRVSTKTFYVWKDINAFNEYITALESSLVTDDEIQAYNSVRKYILKMVTKENPTDKHVEMFLSHYKHVVDFENAKRMQQLGISNGSNTTEFKTIEERKASLLTRLKS